jgi:prepilin-type N-terminal cleavage/methylation domain-containing protein
MNNKLKYLVDKKALTLIEILFVLIILGVVIMIATTMIIQTFGIVGTSSSRMSTDQLTALAQERIERHLRTVVESSDNSFGENLNKWVFNGYSTSGEEIEYEVELSNQRLFLKIADQPQEVILNNVSDFYIKEGIRKGIFIVYIVTNSDSNQIKEKIIVTARNY